MSGICPYCDKLLKSVRVNSVDARESGNKKCKAIMFTCHNCKKILGASFDQTVFNDKIMKAIEKTRKSNFVR